jgi:predicted PurR-regulated permease PerM
MIKTVVDNPWVQAIGLLLALAGICLLAYFLSFVLIPLFLAFLVAYLLDPVVGYLESKRIRRTTAIGGLAVIGVLLLLSSPFVLVAMIGQLDALGEAPQTRGPGGTAEGGNRVQAWVSARIETLPLDEFVVFMKWRDADHPDRPALDIIRSEMAAFVEENALQIVRENLARVSGALSNAGMMAGSTVASVFSFVGRSIVGTIVFLGNLALFAFVAGYLLRDFDGIVKGAHDLVPKKYRPKVVHIFQEISLQLRGFLRGQMVVCLCLGVMYAIGLTIAGTPLGLLIAAFGVLASFIPYLGVVMTLIPAVLFTLLGHGLDWHIVVVLATFIFAQSLEGNVLTPKIVGSQVGLNPVWVILAVLVFGNALGFLGLLLAVPTAASLKVLVVEAVAYYKTSPVFVGGGSADGASALPGPGS